MKRLTIHIFLTANIVFAGCNNKPQTVIMKNTIDIKKRDALVSRYDLMNFPTQKEPVFLTIDEFFDGNSDEASIAPNLLPKPKISEYYSVLKKLSQNPKTITAFAEIKDVMIYENGKLNDNEWFYTDIIYFIGDLTKEEIKEATKSLLPDEVEYDKTNRISSLNKKYQNKKIVSVWWD
jgi:hypothetical protein